MKKKVIIISSAVVAIILGLLCYFNLFDTVGLVYWKNTEGIKYYDSDWRTHFFVSETGNCYVNVNYISKEENYGVENVRKYNNNHWVNRFVRIYDKGDAAAINVNSYGGAIITENNDIYIFLNNNELYSTPKYLCSGYKDALVSEDSIVYLLAKNGDLGYVKADAPNELCLIGKNVKEFNLIRDYFFALTGDNKLFIIGKDEKIENNNKYIDNIYDFDLLRSVGDLNILSIVDNNRDAYVLMENCEVSYDAFSNMSLYKKVGENILSVTSYGMGVAMMDENGNVSLYGSDVDENIYNEDFNGEVVFRDVKATFGGYETLIVVKSNGKFQYYGRMPDGVRRGITPRAR